VLAEVVDAIVEGPHAAAVGAGQGSSGMIQWRVMACRTAEGGVGDWLGGSAAGRGLEEDTGRELDGASQRLQ